MSPDEWQILTLRLKALLMERQAMSLRLAAAASRATAAFVGFNAACREADARIEAKEFTFHPDLVELEMEHAAWNPGEETTQ